MNCLCICQKSCKLRNKIFTWKNGYMDANSAISKGFSVV